MLISKRSIHSGKLHTMDLPITRAQLVRFEAGDEKIQQIFPHLSATEREFLQTGMSPEEQDNIYDPDEPLRKYEVYQMIDISNTSDDSVRRFVGSINAVDLEHAFKSTQNEFGRYEKGWHPDGMRSTMVGDVFIDLSTNIVYIIANQGFNLLPKSSLKIQPK